MSVVITILYDCQHCQRPFEQTVTVENDRSMMLNLRNWFAGWALCRRCRIIAINPQRVARGLPPLDVPEF